MPDKSNLDKKAFLKLLGQQIRGLRESKGLTQSELAIRCDTERQHIFKVEHGEINPTAYLLFHISRALGENIDFLSLPGQDQIHS